MQRDPSCDDDYDNASLTCEAALARMLEAIEPVRGHERLALRSALGRVLATDIHAPFDVPRHTNSAMDGYAVPAAAIAAGGEISLRVVGSAFAGRPFDGAVGAGEAVRIMTGAPMPGGTTVVVMQEHVQRDGDVVRFEAGDARARNVRAAGEDMRAGQRVLDAGRRLGPAELGVIASLGLGEVDVVRRVRVAHLSTGDELRSIGEVLGPGEIYDSNRYTLHGMLRELDVELLDLGVVRDTREAIETALTSAADMADAVISSGGVSVGEADYIKEVLARLGEVRLWKVAMKPGRPLAFGTLGKARFFGLPGNPVSVMITFHQFVRPALLKLAGAQAERPLTVSARTLTPLRKRPGRVEFQRAMLGYAADGTLTVEVTGDQGSGILHSMTSAGCLVVLPMDCAGVAAGEWVQVQPFRALL